MSVRCHQQAGASGLLNTFILSALLTLAVSLLLFTSRPACSETAYTTGQEAIQYGSGQSGSFIRIGNQLFFLEGLGHPQLKRMLTYSSLSGLLSGVLEGSRPLVYATVHATGGKTAARTVDKALRLARSIPLLAGKLANIPAIYNAGFWYMIPSLFSESYAEISRLMGKPASATEYYLFHITSVLFGGLLERTHSVMSGTYNSQNIQLSGDIGQQLFMRVNLNFNGTRQQVIEVHRVSLSHRPPPNTSTPLGRLVHAMDILGSDMLLLIPQSLPMGNKLGLVTTINHPYGNEATVSAINLGLNFAEHRHTPWLETQLLDDSWFNGHRFSSISDHYISALQPELLNVVSESLMCLARPNQCTTGLQEASTGHQRQYTPLHPVELQSSKPELASNEKNYALQFAMGEQSLTIPASFSPLTLVEGKLSGQPDPSAAITQHWVPSWVGNVIRAEVSSALRNIIYTTSSRALLGASGFIGIDNSAPYRAELEAKAKDRHERKVKQQRREQERAERARIREQEQEQATRLRARIQEDANRETQRLRERIRQRLQTRDPSYWDRERERAHMSQPTALPPSPGEGQPIVEPTQGRAAMVALGKKESPDQPVLDQLKAETQRIVRPNGLTDAVPYATLKTARFSNEEPFRDSEHLRFNLYAGGVTGGIHPVTETSPPPTEIQDEKLSSEEPELPECLICLQNESNYGETKRYKCDNQNCSTEGFHLSCLDRWVRTYALGDAERLGSGYHPHTLDGDFLSPCCREHGIKTRLHWIPQ